ncbi:MAG TPA: transcriptional regulator [Zeimonas sp.]|nr:transcriptional regulator [Zeimonas sp.]
MGIPVRSRPPGPARTGRRLRIRLLGALEIRCDEHPLPLPASRKTRALFAWLALSTRAAARGTLCELLWDAPSDPRAELRWSLSKIRGLVDEPGVRRVRTDGEHVRLDLSGDFVDALEIERALADGLEALTPAHASRLASMFDGEFLDGLELARAPLADAWLSAQRRHFRAAHAALLARCATGQTGAAAIPYLERWLALEPFEQRAHRALLGALLGEGRLHDAQAHFALAERLFERERLDRGPLHAAWRALRQRAAPGTIEALAAVAPPEPQEPSQAGSAPDAHRPSIAVMPFVDRPPIAGGVAGLGTSLAHDVVTRLAKLRGVFVIAQGSAAWLHDRGVGPAEAARLLRVDYLCSGIVHAAAPHASVDVELLETRSGRVAWNERFALGDVFTALDEIGDRIVASLAAEIEALERNRAVLLPPDSLDAWSAHHRGLWHMYRFDPQDNAAARGFFEQATRLDPTFARAWAGLSFTHFQNAFQGWTERAPEIERALDAAAQALMADARDPSAHWAMGRALWLRDGHDASVSELEQAIELSPNFALAHYTLAFVHAQAGDPRAAIAAADRARRLSPFDPLLFGMLGSRAIAHLRLGELPEAALWAERAAARPNAHPHIHAIAAFAHALNGSLDAARRHANVIRRTLPGYRYADFAAAFRLDPEAAARFREGARRIGM